MNLVTDNNTTILNGGASVMQLNNDISASSLPGLNHDATREDLRMNNRPTLAEPNALARDATHLSLGVNVNLVDEKLL